MLLQASLRTEPGRGVSEAANAAHGGPTIWAGPEREPRKTAMDLPHYR